MRLWAVVIVIALVSALCGAGVVTGGMDDAPGLQLLSLLVLAAVVVLGVRTVRRTR
ncbi:MAG TPA: hypothetical protein VIT65_05860 [Microlunatus sp.]